MMISLIAAMSKNNVIGDGDKIPWHIPEDFKYFKSRTLGKPVLFGRKTFESIHRIRGTDKFIDPALPDRQNIIITREGDTFMAGNCHVCSSLTSAIQQATKYTDGTNEIMICGGGQIYKQSMNIVDRMYITIIDKEYEGDVFFPEWDDNEWTLTSSEPQDGFAFNIYDRKLKN